MTRSKKIMWWICVALTLLYINSASNVLIYNSEAKFRPSVYPNLLQGVRSQARIDTIQKVVADQHKPQIVQISRGDEVLTPQPISFNMDLRTKSGLTEADLNKVLDPTKLHGLSTYYIQAERETGISALFLVSLSCLESGWGTSYLANTRNNLFGFCAYDTNVNKATYFSSKSDSILKVARSLKTNYLTSSGEYFRGYTISSIRKLYASDPRWDREVYQIMSEILVKVR